MHQGVVKPAGVIPSSGVNGIYSRMEQRLLTSLISCVFRRVRLPLLRIQSCLWEESCRRRPGLHHWCIPFPFIDASSSGRTRVSKTRDGSSTLSASVGWHTGKGHRKAPHAFFRRISGRSKAALKDPASGRFPFPERGGLVKGGMAPWRRPRTVSSHASAFQALGTMALRRTLDPLLGGSNPSAPKGRRRSGNRSSCPFKKDGRNPFAGLL